jgi:hypothetical protein
MPSKSSSYRAELTAKSMVTIAKLRTADVMPELRAEIRTATNPIQPAVRNAARSIPSGHSRYKAKERGGSLRSAVANTIVRKLKFSSRTVSAVIAQVPHGGKSNLANVLEGTIPWKHPTYGHDPEVEQPPHPFFYRAIETLIPGVNARIETVLEKFERKL